MQPSERVNILIVDDQPAKLMSYDAVLSDLGENLIKASSAREALALLLKEEFAVILVDVCMPELDGFQFAEIVRDHPRFKNTAIVFISAVQLDEYDRLRGYQLGAVDYVPVPIIPELLRAKVKVFAELFRKTRELERLNGELETRVAERTAELEASHARLQLALDVARLGTWTWDLQTGEIGWSDRYYRLLGYQCREIEPSLSAWRRRLHPEDAAAVEQQFQHMVETGAEYHQIFRCVKPDGTILWCEARGCADLDCRGRPKKILCVVMDITEHKQSEERQRLMMQELHHRVKNSLATVHALAHLVARTSISADAFFPAFSARLQALSRTHTMLVAHNWQRINIDELMAAETGSFDDGGKGRLTCSGPSIDLPSDLAVSLGLAIHELLTNAVKYGSLSVAGGRVDVTWGLEELSHEAKALELSWVESNGPPVRVPTIKGFGTTLLERIFACQTGAKSEVRYDLAGLQYHMALPYHLPTASSNRSRDMWLALEGMD